MGLNIFWLMVKGCYGCYGCYHGETPWSSQDAFLQQHWVKAMPVGFFHME